MQLPSGGTWRHSSSRAKSTSSTWKPADLRAGSTIWPRAHASQHSSVRQTKTPDELSIWLRPVEQKTQDRQRQCTQAGSDGYHERTESRTHAIGGSPRVPLTGQISKNARLSHQQDEMHHSGRATCEQPPKAAGSSTQRC